MKPNHYRWFAVAGIAVVAITLVAWKSGNSTMPVRYQLNQQADTTPRKHHYRSEYDVADLDRAMKQLDEALSQINVDVNVNVNKEIKAALKEVNKDKIKAEIKASLKDLNLDNIHVDIDNAMKEVHAQIRDIDTKAIAKEVAEATAHIADDIHVNVNLDGLGETIHESLAAAKKGIGRAKERINNLHEFTNALENDKLISRKKGFKVEVKKGDLYINGTKQSKETTDKYRKYFSEDDEYTLKSNGESIGNL